MKKTRISLILLITLFIASCSTKPQVKTVVDIYYSQQLVNQNDEFSNQIIQIYQPFLDKNDSLIIIPDGKIYSMVKDSLNSIDLSYKNGFFGNIQKGGGFQTFEMVVKQANDGRKDIDYKLLRQSLDINNQRINSLDNLIKKVGYGKVVVYSTTLKDKTWKEYNVYHDINELKDEIQNNLKENLSSSILIIYNPSESGVGGNSSSIEKTLLTIADTKKTDEERAKLANDIWIKYFSEKLYVELTEIDSLGNTIPIIYYFPPEGKKFLDYLCIENSFISFNVKEIKQDNETGKISSLSLQAKVNGMFKVNSK